MQLFDRPQKGERAVLVHVDFSKNRESEDIDEFRELVISAGAEPVVTIKATRRTPDPRYFVGSGKAEEIHAIVEEQCADVVLFNHALSPGQERNLERLIQCRILDRTGVILDIFAQRARSFEGKLQVELAQLRYMASRLVRGWTHLERQKGGIGLRGPGETQLETDRRLIGVRIKQLNKRLERFAKQRQGQRRARLRSRLATVSLVGYTNAGKSTLFNKMTGANVLVEDKLFATLDPTLRRIPLAGANPVIIADTVGFINHLPHGLIAAFRATLEETTHADLLLHVVDAHDEDHLERIEQVNEVLNDIGADQIPQLIVYNKIDVMPGVMPRLDRNEAGYPQRVWISATTGQGLDLLQEALAEFSAEYSGRSEDAGNRCSDIDKVRGNSEKLVCCLRISPKASHLRAELFEQGVVVNEVVASNGDFLVDINVFPHVLQRFLDEDDCSLDVDEDEAAYV